MKIFFFLMFFLFSSSVFAVDRAAAYASCAPYASYAASHGLPGAYCKAVGLNTSTPSYCLYADSTGCNFNYGFGMVYFTTTCNSGTWNDTTNTCWQTCISPSINNSTGVCFKPIECKYPESDNGNGVCQNNACGTGQVRNPSTNLCQVKPTCGSTETYDAVSNTCKLYPLACPGHTHASTANDACLPDAPLTCPTGQHDDGTYTCVANNATACSSGQQSGYIGGQQQCIPKPQLDTLQQAAANAAAGISSAQANFNSAQATAIQAADALAANSTSTSLQTAKSAADAALSTASSALASSTNSGVSTQNTAVDTALGQIATALQQQNDKKTAEDNAASAAAATGSGVNIPAPDSILSKTFSVSMPTISSGGSCPGDVPVGSLSGVVWHWSPICTFAGDIHPFILIMGWLSAAYIVFGAVTR